MFNIFKKKTESETSDLYLFNTMSGKKELFKPRHINKVGLYTCGPTVYSYQHLGNMRAYIAEDILKRTLAYNGYQVNHVMNITDVGHLTGDRDMGEDKLEKKASAEGKTAWEISDYYTRLFKEDIKKLNVIYPNIFCKATDHIAEQIELIKRLQDNNLTYRTSDGIYFDTAKFPDYGALSHQKLEDLREGARVEINEEKKNPTDFALWKFSPSNIKRQMEWNSPWGIGFPGWHIECSAMSMKYLGEQFDIHCGGIDHIPLHHTNEIAQTEGATGKKPWVNYWFHVEFLNFAGGKKISKSAGHIVTLDNTYIEKGFSPLAHRYACLTTSYHKPMEWSEESFISATNGYNNLIEKVKKVGKKVGSVNIEYKNNFLIAINDDLNVTKALAVTQEVLKSNISNEDKLATVLDFDQVLGLGFEQAIKDDVLPEKIPDEIGLLLAQRQEARVDKNWLESDRIRDEIQNHGWTVKDTTDGQQVTKI